jgi:hypothetical protein
MRSLSSVWRKAIGGNLRLRAIFSSTISPKPLRRII